MGGVSRRALQPLTECCYRAVDMPLIRPFGGTTLSSRYRGHHHQHIMGATGERLSVAETPEQLHRVFQDAFNRHDADSIAALYEADAVLVSIGGPVEGIDAIREWYRAALTKRPRIEVRTVTVSVAGGLAMLQGKWSSVAQGPDDCEVQTEGNNVEVARRQPDGHWLFVIDNPGSTDCTAPH